MREPKTPPALILCCVDYRYIEAIQAFVKRELALATYDLRTDAGGVKALLNGDRAVREWILSNVGLAYRRHGVRTAVLVHHEDCAAYGGSSAFKDGAKETAFHAQQLAMASSLLRASFSRFTVRMFYAHRASRRIVFAEIVGSRPRDRAASHMRPPFTEHSDVKGSAECAQHLFSGVRRQKISAGSIRPAPLGERGRRKRLRTSELVYRRCPVTV